MSNQTTAISSDRALAINSAMAEAWFIRNGIKPGPLPDLRWFSPQEAERVSIMMRDEGLGRETLPNGSIKLTSFVEPTRVVNLYAWALATWADGGLGVSS